MKGFFELGRKKKELGVKRSETITIRLDPKLRYFTELGARVHRRNLSNFIEWSIEQSLRRVYLVDHDNVNRVSLAEKYEALWDVYEPDRLIKLALNCPELLTHDEQIVWRLIRENERFKRKSSDAGENWWKSEEGFNYKQLRENWETLKAVAQDREDRSKLEVPGTILFERFDDGD